MLTPRPTYLVVSLHSELRTLRSSICQSCKRKFVPVSSQATPPGTGKTSLGQSIEVDFCTPFILLPFQLWGIPNKRIRNIFRGHILRVESVNFSPDGRLVVSTSWDGSVRIWNQRDCFAKVFMDIDDALSWFVSFSQTGQFIAVGTDMTDTIMKKWDARTSQLVKHLRWTGHIGSVCSVAFSPDGRGLVSSSGDGVVRWDHSI